MLSVVTCSRVLRFVASVVPVVRGAVDGLSEGHGADRGVVLSPNRGHSVDTRCHHSAIAVCYHFVHERLAVDTD